MFFPRFIGSATTKRSCLSASLPNFFWEQSAAFPPFLLRMWRSIFNAWLSSRRSRSLPRWPGTPKAPPGSSASLATHVCTAEQAFTLRPTAGKEILLTGADYSGVDLQRRVGALIVTERDQALPMAVQVAASWAKLPRATLAAWKKHTATTLQEKIRNLQAADGRQRKDEALEPAPDAAAPIALHSKVVTATGRPDGVVVVKMEDREAKNMFSDALIEGVREAFAHIERTPAYKVVILTGYDSYFASGGTKESLLAIGQGKAKFTDVKIFQEPLDCKLPVIAAMQGHGIGAGWAMGLFADVVLLSEESRYLSPYMNYGFTPGA